MLKEEIHVSIAYMWSEFHLVVKVPNSYLLMNDFSVWRLISSITHKEICSVSLSLSIPVAGTSVKNAARPSRSKNS